MNKKQDTTIVKGEIDNVCYNTLNVKIRIPIYYMLGTVLHTRNIPKQEELYLFYSWGNGLDEIISILSKDTELISYRARIQI